jgi:hypothetical protein
MRQIKRFEVEFELGFTFECIKGDDGKWKCSGDIDGVQYDLKFDNLSETHVFQVLHNLYVNKV